MGRIVNTLYNGSIEPGRYSIQWNADNNKDERITSGIYFIKFSSDLFHKTAKVLYLK